MHCIRSLGGDVILGAQSINIKVWCVKEDTRALQTSRKKAACSQVAYIETGTNSQLYCLKYIPKVLHGT